MFTIGLVLYLLAVFTEAMGDGERWYVRLWLHRILPVTGCVGFALMMVSIGIAGWKLLP